MVGRSSEIVIARSILAMDSELSLYGSAADGLSFWGEHRTALPASSLIEALGNKARAKPPAPSQRDYLLAGALSPKMARSRIRLLKSLTSFIGAHIASVIPEKRPFHP